MNASQIENVTKRWVEEWVIRLNLCPFAARPNQSGSVQYIVCDKAGIDPCFDQFLETLEAFAEASSAEIETSLFIIPNGLDTFERYLDFLAAAEHALVLMELEGVVQIASFHPRYCFEGEDETDVANYTNRSPYPMLHLLRESSLDARLENYPDVENIPQANIVRLRGMGLKAVETALEEIQKSVENEP